MCTFQKDTCCWREETEGSVVSILNVKNLGARKTFVKVVPGWKERSSLDVLTMRLTAKIKKCARSS